MSDNTTMPLPQPDEITTKEKDEAMGAYFMMLAAWGVGLPLPLLNLVASTIYYGIHKKKSNFVAFHALQSLLSQIPISLVNISIWVWFMRYLFFDVTFSGAFLPYCIFAIALNLTYCILSLMALLRASNGNFFYFPLFGRWAFERFYGSKALNKGRTEPKSNHPPESFR